MTLRYLVRRFYYQFSFLRVLMYPLVAMRHALLKRWVAVELLNKAQEQLFAEAPLLSVQEFEGVFRIGTKSDLLKRLLRNGNYEPELARLARVLIDPEKDVIDIGANVGFFTVLATKHTDGRVFAVEPVPQIIKFLRQNLEHNGVTSRVTIFEGVICDTQGAAAVHIVSAHEEYSSIVKIEHPAAKGIAVTTIQVPALTLDKFVASYSLNPGFIKIDVEGAEHKVLKGARDTLLNARPIVMSEFSPKLLKANDANPTELIKELRGLGYRVVDPLFCDLVPGRRAFGDLLAVPEERLSESEFRKILTAEG